MPALTKAQLFERVRLGLQAAGWGIVFDTPNQNHPFRVSIFKESESYRLLIYIWTVTHGGGAARAADEFRIQLTGVSPPLAMESGRQTLLLGWSEDFGVFAAFDPLRHQTFSTASPSIQIKQANLQTAAQGGMSPYARGNGEIALAISPDALAGYVSSQDRLHAYGDISAELDVLEAAGQGTEIPDQILSQLPPERQITVSAVTRLARESSFRIRVIRAYDSACAVCEMQLGLAQAAHIVPVATQGSTDETSNGLALCPLHHLGYDAAILAVHPNYTVQISAAKLAGFQAANLAGGQQRFSQVRPTIVLPSQATDKPRPEYLQRGLEVRAFAA